MKKIKSFCETKVPAKEQIKKYKRKANEWCDDDDKCVHICEDLAFGLTHYINLGVIKADDSRKNLGITNNQSVRIKKNDSHNNESICERKQVIQYKIPGLPYRVDLCFIAHKLIVEIDEDGHPYYKHDENLGFTFIRINPDPNAGFDPDVEIAKIYNYINESPVKLAVNLAEKSFKEKFAKELLSDMSCFSGPLKYIKYFIEKILPTM